MTPGKHEVSLRVFLIDRAPLGLITLKLKVNRRLIKNNNNFEAINSVFDFQEWLSNPLKHEVALCSGLNTAPSRLIAFVKFIDDICSMEEQQ